MYNLIGQEVFSQALQGGETTLDVDFAPGIYLYQIAGNGTAHNGKLLVE